MKKQEIKTLKLIESLERNPKQTQRNLARELNISLGLVNSFTKRMIQKGFFKVKTVPKNRIKYILTPEGMYEKTRLTYQYILYSLDFYKETRAKLKLIYDQLAEQGKKRIFFIGASELTEIALLSLKESHLKLAGIIDDELVGTQFMGFVIMRYSSLEVATSDDIIIITKTDSDKDLSGLIPPHIITANIIDLRR
jgi:DNA-binding MarR family transcriptional regulator